MSQTFKVMADILSIVMLLAPLGDSLHFFSERSPPVGTPFCCCPLSLYVYYLSSVIVFICLVALRMTND